MIPSTASAQKLFLKRDFFDSLNGLRYRQVGGTRQRHFAGTNSKPRNLPENSHVFPSCGSPTTTPACLLSLY
jgi:hypothetical protein